MLLGILTCGLAAMGVWQIVSQNIIPDVGRWYVNGGRENISLLGDDFDINARLLASGTILLPILFAAFGVWALFSAFRRNQDLA
jgi:hypothetical protein